MNRRLISEILTAKWNIHGEWAQAHLPLLIALLKGSTAISFVDRTGNQQMEQPFAVDPRTMDRYDLTIYDYRSERYVPNPNIPQGSIGILPMSGPLYYYNGQCGEPGMMQRSNWLANLMKRDNISAIIQLVDTPGGSVDAAPAYINTLSKRSKFTMTLVDNMCASLGLWMSSGSDATYLSHDMAQMGSCGSYWTLIDSTGALEQEGYKLIEVYAPQSVDKNKMFRDAFNGDTSLIKEDLRLHVDKFISYIKTNRGDVAAANEEKWNTGKMFYAKDAVKVGLADGTMDFSKAVGYASWKAKRTKT